MSRKDMLHGCSRKETKAEAGGYSNTEIKSPKNRGVLAPINSTFQVCADCTSLRKTLSNSLCLKMKQLVTSGDVRFHHRSLADSRQAVC
jgi:hypothetical protein